MELTCLGAVAYSNAAFGAGIGTSLFASVNCNGSESSLLECSYNNNGCSHTNDAGVRCQGKNGVHVLRPQDHQMNPNTNEQQD